MVTDEETWIASLKTMQVMSSPRPSPGISVAEAVGFCRAEPQKRSACCHRSPSRSSVCAINLALPSLTRQTLLPASNSSADTEGSTSRRTEQTEPQGNKKRRNQELHVRRQRTNAHQDTMKPKTTTTHITSIISLVFAASSLGAVLDFETVNSTIPVEGMTNSAQPRQSTQR